MHLPHRWKALRAYLARRKHCIAITCSPKLNTKRLLLQISSSRTWALFLPHHTDKGADLEEDVTCLRPRSRTQTPGSLAAEPVFGVSAGCGGVTFQGGSEAGTVGLGPGPSQSPLCWSGCGSPGRQSPAHLELRCPAGPEPCCSLSFLPASPSLGYHFVLPSSP